MPTRKGKNYSIPAARKAVPSLGKKWVTSGHSSGGISVWGVDEMEAELHDPNFLGSISVAGTADMTAIMRQIDKANLGMFNTYLAHSMELAEPGFDRSTFLNKSALERYADVTTRGCRSYTAAAFVGAEGPQLKPGWDKLPAVLDFERLNKEGEAQLGAPLLVFAGEADDDVAFELTKTVVKRACRNGIPVTFRHYSGFGHMESLDDTTHDQMQ